MIKMEKVKPLFYLPKFKAQKYKYNLKKNEHLSQKMLIIYWKNLKNQAKLKLAEVWIWFYYVFF